MNEYVIRVQMYNGVDNGTPVPAIRVKSNLRRLEYRDMLEELIFQFNQDYEMTDYDMMLYILYKADVAFSMGSDKGYDVISTYTSTGECNKHYFDENGKEVLGV